MLINISRVTTESTTITVMDKGVSHVFTKKVGHPINNTNYLAPITPAPSTHGVRAAALIAFDKVDRIKQDAHITRLSNHSGRTNYYYAMSKDKAFKALNYKKYVCITSLVKFYNDYLIS